jgi:hypothetical protein
VWGIFFSLEISTMDLDLYMTESKIIIISSSAKADRIAFFALWL